MYKWSTYILLMLLSFQMLGQEVDLGKTSTLMRKEYSFGLNINTRGWGFAFDYGWQKNYKYKQTVGFTVTNIRHEKEHKIYGGLNNSTKGYYLGKLESLISFRPQYGGKLILFNAKRENGIEVALKWNTGVSFGLVKPVYLKIEKINSNAIDERYNPTIHNTGNITSRSSWFVGLGEANIRMGAFGKFGFDFNFSALKNSISGGEFGIMLDYFPGKRIEILHNNSNSIFYSSLYLQFNLGQKLY